MPTYNLPENLGDILGAHHDGNFNTQLSEIKAGIGVPQKRHSLSFGNAGDIGKLVLLTAGTEAQAYGVLLDPSVDTAAAFGDGTVTGSIAKSGTFKGSALLVPAGVDAGLISVALRGRGIFCRRRNHSRRNDSLRGTGANGGTRANNGTDVYNR